MKAVAARFAPWSIVAVVTLLFAGVGVFVGQRIRSATADATMLAYPHEVQTALEHIGAAIDVVDDAVQDYIIEGAEGRRLLFQYEDGARSLQARTAELVSLGSPAISASDLAEVNRRVAEVLVATRAVIDASNANRAEALRRLAEEGRATNNANRKLETLIAGQQQQLRAREWSLQRNVGEISWGLAATAAMVIFALAAAIVLIQYDRRRQADTRERLTSENARLEIAVREGSDTLAQTKHELTWFSRRALQIQEHERRNLALELHDQIGQELAALVFALTRCDQELAPFAPPEKRAALQAGIEIARAAYGDVHNLALELRPAMLDRLGLLPTLQWYARQQAKFAHCEIAVEAETFPAGVPSDILTAAYRIVQEAVSNAVRHANPRRIEIQALSRPGQIEVRIRDDGVGFDVAAVATQHEPRIGLGLVGIRQRAHDAGGEVSIVSIPGSGTEIIASLSLRDAS
jgi:signal transduction histidine kinase